MIDLKDIKPQASKFTLYKNGKEYNLRPVSLDDEIWMNQTFGDRLNEIFTKLEMDGICRIVFHQLVDEDKNDFESQEVTVINEDGDKQSFKVGGYKLLRAMMIGGMQEKTEIINALLETIGISRPIANELKKEVQKKSPMKRQTGR